MTVAVLWIVPLLACWGGLEWLAVLSDADLSEVNAYGTALVGAGRDLYDIVSAVVLFAGLTATFVVPGALIVVHVESIATDPARLVGVTPLVSIVVVTAATSVYKLLFEEIDRAAMLLVVGVLTVALIALWLVRTRTAPPAANRPQIGALVPVVVLAVVTALTMLAFGPPLDGEALNLVFAEELLLATPLGGQGDLIETYGLANSLHDHILPWWDLEYGDRMGYGLTIPPLAVFVYVVPLLLFGQTMVSFTMTSLAFSAFAFAVILSFSQVNLRLRTAVISALMITQILTFAGDTEMWVYPDFFFATLLVLMWFYLARGDFTMGLIYAAALTFTRYQALLFVAIAIVGAIVFLPDRRPEVFRFVKRYLIVVAVVAAFVVSVAAFGGHLRTTGLAILIEQMGRFDVFGLLAEAYPDLVITQEAGADPPRRLWFLGRTLLASGGTFLGLLLFGRSGKENFLSFVGLVFLAGVLVSSNQFERYALPLVPLSALLAVLKLDRWFFADRSRA